ncbi:MAG: chromosomal replication initiator protein DnaA [Dehalococcoidia bacterium]|jgi:chromosomal replication initiator protein|nr:chromosomal replication initiator protein DnaA [Dehalococcoidia bacterium]
MLVKESASEIWEAVLGELQLQVNRTNFDTWLKDTVGLSYEGDKFVVGVPSPFAVEWLEKRLISLIEKTLIGVVGDGVNVCFQIQEQIARSKPKGNGKFSASVNHRKTGSNTFNPKYTFDSFIVGTCNRLAHAAAMGVAEKPGHVYNPLFIYGGVGLGKTHLLHAIGRCVTDAKLRVLYVSTEQFTNEFIKAIRERKTEEFRSKYRSVDVLLIDDIHFIIGKEQTQEGFFHTFNDLHNGSRQIVITSDRPPKSMPLLEDRLRSRFAWGLVTDVQSPELETRLAILQAKAEENDISLPQDVLEFIARKVLKSIRELEGSLNRIVAFSRLTKAPLTLELAEKALAEFPDTAPRRALSPPLIITNVAKYFELEPEALIGRRRDKPTALARHVAIYLIREEIQCSFNEIGKELGNRDHSAVLRGYDKIALEINTRPQLRHDVIEIREGLTTRSKV